MEQNFMDVPIILPAGIPLTRILKNAPTTVIVKEVMAEDGIENYYPCLFKGLSAGRWP